MFLRHLELARGVYKSSGIIDPSEDEMPFDTQLVLPKDNVDRFSFGQEVRLAELFDIISTFFQDDQKGEQDSVGKKQDRVNR